MRNFIILSLVAVLMASCYEKQEGCLDFRAENYDFGADEPCSDCCDYPNMKIGVTHNWGDTTLMIDSTYSNFMNQSIRILNAQFYITDVGLVDDGEQVSVIETLTVTDAQGLTQEISAANAFVQNTRFTYTLGSFEEAKSYEGLSFKVGVDGDYTAESLVENDLFFDDVTYEYVNFRMEYINDVDTLQFELEGREFVTPVNLDAILEIPLGVDFTIQIAVDYQLLLGDIDIKNIDSQLQKTRVQDNFQRCFSFQ